AVVEDPLDLARLGGPRLGGAHIARKLLTMVGLGDLAAAAVTYGADPLAADFVAVLSAQSGRDLAPFVRQWTTAPRAVDYRLEVASRRVAGTPAHETTVRVTARPPAGRLPDGLAAEAPALEPVPVAIRLRGGGEERVTLEAPEAAAFSLRTSRPFAAVEVDPDRVTEDRWREDNRLPPRWRVLVTEFSATLDIREGELSLAAALRAQRGRERRPVYGLRAFRDQESAGLTASVGLALPPWPRDWRHGVTLAITGERLDPDFGPEESDARWITEVTAGYGFDSRRDRRHPLSGGTAGVTLTLSDAALGSDADYLIVRGRLTRYLRVGPRQALALRAEVGETLDGQPPFGKGLLLGGFDGLRAYPTDAFSGRSLSLGSVEYRFPVVRDLDQWVAGLIGFGGLSAVVGVEAGQASDDHNPFRWSEYRTGLNVGLRFAVRIFGVSPVLWSLDAAMPLDGGPQPGDTRYYISASQTF
ncbi:MAG TPA: BamA/TamA family outer membrane protein, partial [Thermodesulfobacteriota bacterium]